MTNTTMAAPLRRFRRPYDWDAIDAAIRDQGAAITENVLGDELVAHLNRDIDDWLK